MGGKDKPTRPSDTFVDGDIPVMDDSKAPDGAAERRDAARVTGDLARFQSAPKPAVQSVPGATSGDVNPADTVAIHIDDLTKQFGLEPLADVAADEGGGNDLELGDPELDSDDELTTLTDDEVVVQSVDELLEKISRNVLESWRLAFGDGLDARAFMGRLREGEATIRGLLAEAALAGENLAKYGRELSELSNVEVEGKDLTDEQLMRMEELRGLQRGCREQRKSLRETLDIQSVTLGEMILDYEAKLKNAETEIIFPSSPLVQWMSAVLKERITEKASIVEEGSDFTMPLVEDFNEQADAIVAACRKFFLDNFKNDLGLRLANLRVLQVKAGFVEGEETPYSSITSEENLIEVLGKYLGEAAGQLCAAVDKKFEDYEKSLAEARAKAEVERQAAQLRVDFKAAFEEALDEFKNAVEGSVAAAKGGKVDYASVLVDAFSPRGEAMEEILLKLVRNNLMLGADVSVMAGGPCESDMQGLIDQFRIYKDAKDLSGGSSEWTKRELGGVLRKAMFFLHASFAKYRSVIIQNESGASHTSGKLPFIDSLLQEVFDEMNDDYIDALVGVSKDVAQELAAVKAQLEIVLEEQVALDRTMRARFRGVDESVQALVEVLPSELKLSDADKKALVEAVVAAMPQPAPQGPVPAQIDEDALKAAVCEVLRAEMQPIVKAAIAEVLAERRGQQPERIRSSRLRRPARPQPKPKRKRSRSRKLFLGLLALSGIGVGALAVDDCRTGRPSRMAKDAITDFGNMVAHGVGDFIALVDDLAGEDEVELVPLPVAPPPVAPPPVSAERLCPEVKWTFADDISDDVLRACDFAGAFFLKCKEDGSYIDSKDYTRVHMLEGDHPDWAVDQGQGQRGLRLEGFQAFDKNATQVCRDAKVDGAFFHPLVVQE
jgi:hypothetical protein